MSTLNTSKRRSGIGPGKFMGASGGGVVRRVTCVTPSWAKKASGRTVGPRGTRGRRGPAVAERRAGNWSIGHEAA